LTSFIPNQLGFPSNVGLGTERAGERERLLVYGVVTKNGTSLMTALAHADFQDFVLTGLTQLTPQPRLGYPADVKVDAYGRVFIADVAGTLVSVDVTTGKVLGRDETGLQAGTANALLTWNDDIYLFTQAQGLLHRYDLATKSAVLVDTIGDEIVGASAAPCLH
jgi:outer membrane protein assembly factor BamB